MLTIEHCESLHVHLGERQDTILSRALAAAIAQGVTRKPCAPGVQTPATLPALGEVWTGQGGRYGAAMPALGGKPGWHIIVVDAQVERVTYGPHDHDVPGARDTHDGLANTRALLQDAKEHPAARWAAAQKPEGHEDCYLASHAEMQLLRVGVPHLFKAGYYWTSTQYSPHGAWVQLFEDGGSGIDIKGGEFRAVAVRRLVL